MGLTPKHREPAPKLDWISLNDTLKTCIDHSNWKDPYVTLDLDNYSMQSDEIISEMQRNGYTVERTDDNNKIVVR